MLKGINFSLKPYTVISQSYSCCIKRSALTLHQVVQTGQYDCVVQTGQYDTR